MRLDIIASNTYCSQSHRLRTVPGERKCSKITEDDRADSSTQKGCHQEVQQALVMVHSSTVCSDLT